MRLYRMTLPTLANPIQVTTDVLTDPFYSSLLTDRIAGSERFYKKGIYKLSDTFKIYAYIDHNKHKRFTLAKDGELISGLLIDHTKTVKKMYTLPTHKGNAYNKQLRAVVQTVIKEKFHYFDGELSEKGRHSIGI